MWDKLDELQRGLVAAVEEHRTLCSTDTPDRGALSASRWRVAQAGRVRMDYLTGTVFPAIESHSNAAGYDRFAALRDATAPYQRQVSAYVARWPTEAIITQWTAYKREARVFRDAILARVAQEVEVIRPLLAEQRADRLPIAARVDANVGVPDRPR